MRPDQHALVVLDASGVAEACRMTHPLWHQGMELGPYARRVEEALDRMRGAMRYVGMRSSDGSLAASARVLDMDLSVGGRIERAIGIAAVFVAEDRRGHGLGGDLVRALLQDGSTRGADHALLYSDIGARYYEALGFTAFPAFDWWARADDLPEGAPLDVREATEKDLGVLVGLFNARAAQHGLCPARNADWWTQFRWWRQTDPDLILTDEGREVAYITVRRDAGLLRLLEWVAPDMEPRRVWATIGSEAARSGLGAVGGWLQPDRREPWMTVTGRLDALPMMASTWRAAGETPALRSGDAVFEELDHF